MRGVWVSPQMCCGRAIWDGVTGFTRIEGESEKFFEYTGKKKAPEWEQFGHEFVLGQIRTVMTRIAREGSGWPVEWSTEGV